MNGKIMIAAVIVCMAGMCKAGDDVVVKAGQDLGVLLEKKYGGVAATNNILRDIRNLDIAGLFRAVGLTGTNYTSIVASNQTAITRSYEFEGPGGGHSEQVRMLLVEGTYNVQAARKGLLEVMGSGLTMAIDDSTFGRIEGGPGNECYALNSADAPPTADSTLRNIWFRRDNIAVQLSCSGDRNLMPLARTLDTAIVNSGSAKGK